MLIFLWSRASQPVYWGWFNVWAVRNWSTYSWRGSPTAKALMLVPQDIYSLIWGSSEGSMIGEEFEGMPHGAHKLKEWKLAFSAWWQETECPGGALPPRFLSQLPSTECDWSFWKRDVRWYRSSCSSWPESIADVAQGAAGKGWRRADCGLLVMHFSSLSLLIGDTFVTFVADVPFKWSPN